MALGRRPFRLTGRSEPQPNGRALAGEYHHLGAAVHWVVDIVAVDDDKTLLSIEGIPFQDNPLAQLFRNPADRAVAEAFTRLGVA